MEHIINKIEASWENIKDGIEVKLRKEITDAIKFLRHSPSRALPTAISECQRFQAMCDSFQSNNYPLGIFGMMQNYTELVEYLKQGGS